MTIELEAAPTDGTTDTNLNEEQVSVNEETGTDTIDTSTEQQASNPHHLLGGDDPMQKIPDKFLNEDGEPDYDKLVKSYNNLEKMKDVPKSVDDYKVPESLADHKYINFSDESVSEFKQGALEMGISQKQLAWVLEQHAKSFESYIPTPQALESKLKEDWGADDYDTNINNAALALEEFGADLDDVEVIGNVPLIKFAAKVNQMLQQDKPDIKPVKNVAGTEDELDKLIASPEYLDKDSDVRKRADKILESMSK